MNTTQSTKPLKSGNTTWLCSLALFDVALLLILVFPDAVTTLTVTRLVAGRMSLTAIIPVAVLLLSSLLPPGLKATLVYFRVTQALPGHRAFSVHAPNDARIDMKALQKNVGAFPTVPSEQNSLWYKLYKKVVSDGAVIDAHRGYLLFRDMAAMSFLLLLAVPISLGLLGVVTTSIWVVAGVLLAQYILTALAAMQSGTRFVKNVLAIHSVRKVTTPR